MQCDGTLQPMGICPGLARHGTPSAAVAAQRRTAQPAPSRCAAEGTPKPANLVSEGASSAPILGASHGRAAVVGAAAPEHRGAAQCSGEFRFALDCHACGCNMQHAACYLQHATVACYLQHATVACYLQHATRSMLLATCNCSMLLATCNCSMLLATCYSQHATCNMQL